MESGLANSLIMNTFAGVMSFIIGILLAKWQEKKNENDELRMKSNQEHQALINGVRSTLKMRLLLTYKFHKAKGYVPRDDMEIITDMYSSYHLLGGNGTISALYDEMMNDMPHTPPKYD